MAKNTPEEQAQLDDLKAQADAAGIEYGGNIGIDTLAARIDEDAPQSAPDDQAAPVDHGPAKIMVEVNGTNPNPVRLTVNGKRLGDDIWQGVTTEVSEEALEALTNSAVSFVFISGQKE
jgi:hypothetical protein